MIIVQKKAKKVGNSLIGLAFTLVAKHYATLEYIKEDEDELIVVFNAQRKQGKRHFESP
jgi:hypothetical protein